LFVPTHPHIDHVGGLMDMPDLPVLMTPEDMALVRRALTSVTFEVVPAHAQRLIPLMKELTFAKVPCHGFAESADIFGDKTVLAVRLPGHTPGSIGVFVTVRPGFEIFHVGDAVTTIEQLEAGSDKPFYLQRTDYDPAQTRATVDVLQDLHRAERALKIITAHDRTSWQAVFGRPGDRVTP
jgi:glyoxylase-like metal-dependent hydrolase (beta-lactamase superfamily II)